MTKILPCSCKNPFQDKTYGKRKRLHNSTKGAQPDWKCTVCGKVRKR